MGAISPAPALNEKLNNNIFHNIIMPTINGMRSDGTPYEGILYAGVMLTDEGPKVIEFNCRFGDPETQVLILRLKSDLLPALIACVDGQLSSFDLRWDSASAVCVVMATKGYPGNYTKGSVIRGIDTLKDNDNMKIFHAGTTRSSEGQIIADGGRVLGVTALGADISLAQRNAYLAVDKVHWPEGFFRRDIGWRAIKK